MIIEVLDELKIEILYTGYEDLLETVILLRGCLI